MISKNHGFLVSVLLLPALPALSQTPICESYTTVHDCNLRVIRGIEEVRQVGANAVDDSTNAQAREMGTKVAKKLTTFDAAGSLLGTDAKSLLELFAVAVEDAQVNDDTGAVALTWNSNLFGLSGHDQILHNRVQVQTVINKPQLFEPLREAIPEAERAARTEILKGQIRDLDDVTLSLTYSRENRSLGRGSDLHRPLLHSVLQWKADRVDSGLADTLEDQWLQLSAGLTEELAKTLTLSRLAEDLASRPEGERPSFLEGFYYSTRLTDEQKKGNTESLLAFASKVADVQKELRTLMSEALGGETLNRFDDLINNQLEVTGSVDLRFRSEFTGANHYSLGATLKTGLANVNWIREELGKACETKWSESCQDRYRVLINDNEERIVKPWNIVVKLEYKHEDDYAFTIPALEEGEIEMNSESEPVRRMAAIPVTRSATDEIMVSFSASKVLARDSEGVQIAGLAGNATYNFVDNENDQEIMGRQERLVLSLTYTQRINDEFSLPIGLVWANKGEFLPEVDKNFSVNFGLKFRLLKNENR